MEEELLLATLIRRYKRKFLLLLSLKKKRRRLIKIIKKFQFRRKLRFFLLTISYQFNFCIYKYLFLIKRKNHIYGNRKKGWKVAMKRGNDWYRNFSQYVPLGHRWFNGLYNSLNLAKTKKRVLTPKMELFAALYHLRVGGDLRGTAIYFGISAPTVYRILVRVLPKIIASLDYIKFDVTNAITKVGAIGAIDCTHHPRHRTNVEVKLSTSGVIASF